MISANIMYYFSICLLVKVFICMFYVEAILHSISTLVFILSLFSGEKILFEVNAMNTNLRFYLQTIHKQLPKQFILI